MSTRNDPFTQLMRSGRAATYVLIALLGICYVAAWATKSPAFVVNLMFVGDWAKPWTALVYPLATSGNGDGFVWQLLLLFWLYWIGGDLEREVGSIRVFAMFWISSVIGALAVYLAILIGHTSVGLAGSVIPIGALTVAWGVRNPTASIRLWMVLPITGKWIAILEVGIVLFSVGNGSVLAGFFALVPLGFAALFAAGRLPGLAYGQGLSRRESKVAKATERRRQSYYDEVYKRSKEREEQEKLRKLFERSLDDEK